MPFIVTTFPSGNPKAADVSELAALAACGQCPVPGAGHV